MSGLVTRAAAVCAALTVWATTVPPSRAADDAAGCVSHGLDIKQIKQRLRRWPGLAPFHHWRLRKVVPADCVVGGLVDTLLVLAPPASWSHLGVAYRVRVKLCLDGASGAPGEGLPVHFKELAAGVRRVLERAENNEIVRRFVERYPPVRADFRVAEDRESLQVTYQTQAGPLAPSATPRLVFSEEFDGIAAYRIPRMDGLPVRPELLRMAEMLSRRHPGCRPVWIQAERAERAGYPLIGPPSDGADRQDTGRWMIDLTLEGAGCPVSFAGVVTPDRAVVDLRVSPAVRQEE